jgi:hypothetical protein
MFTKWPANYTVLNEAMPTIVKETEKVVKG